MKSVKKYFNLWLPFETKEERLKRIPDGDENGTDNEKLLFFQKKFLESGDEKYFLKLWTLFRLLCLKAVKKEKRAKGFYLDRDEEGYKADIAAEYSLRRYLSYKQTKGELYCIANFIAEAYNSAMHALYSESENDFFFEKCRELNGKPLEEARKRAGFMAQAKKNGMEKTDADGAQLFLFGEENESEDL